MYQGIALSFTGDERYAIDVSAANPEKLTLTFYNSPAPGIHAGNVTMHGIPLELAERVANELLRLVEQQNRALYGNPCLIPITESEPVHCEGCGNDDGPSYCKGVHAAF